MVMAAPLLLRIRAIRLGPVGLLLRGPPRLAGAGAGEEEGTSEEEADGAEADGPNAQ